jgi:hypothetical protein
LAARNPQFPCVVIFVQDPVTNRKLFKDALELPLERHEGDEYFFIENIAGSKHSGLWPLSQAAEAESQNLDIRTFLTLNQSIQARISPPAAQTISDETESAAGM